MLKLLKLDLSVGLKHVPPGLLEQVHQSLQRAQSQSLLGGWSPLQAGHLQHPPRQFGGAGQQLNNMNLLAVAPGKHFSLYGFKFIHCVWPKVKPYAIICWNLLPSCSSICWNLCSPQAVHQFLGIFGIGLPSQLRILLWLCFKAGRW